MNYKAKKKSAINALLPSSGKKNLSKNGKRLPLTSLQAHAMRRKPLEIDTFQRAAQKFYSTSRLGYLLALVNEQTNDFVRIDFCKDFDGYLTIYCSKNNCHVLLYSPTSNRDLFLKITSKNLL